MENDDSINNNEDAKRFSFGNSKMSRTFITQSREKFKLRKSKTSSIPNQFQFKKSKSTLDMFSKSNTFQLKRGLMMKTKKPPTLMQPQIGEVKKPPSVVEKIYIDIQKIKKYTKITMNQYRNRNKVRTIEEEEKQLKKKNSCLSLASISTKKCINCYNIEKMHHIRSFTIDQSQIEKKTFEIYALPSFLKNSRYNVQDPKMQIETIIDKSKIILDNIAFFKGNYMYSAPFINAFNNLTEKYKAKYNQTIEELCAVLMKLPPVLMNKFYDSLDQILYCQIPEMYQEKKIPLANETECMKANYRFFNDVSVYFTGVVEVFRVLAKKIVDLRYPRDKFCKINLLLDTARYDSSTLISFARAYIEKTRVDNKILADFEEGLELREKKRVKESNDYLERYRAREKKKEITDNSKISRVVSALDMDIDLSKRKKYGYNLGGDYSKCLNQTSLLNLGIVSEMMKYIDKPIRERIIAQRVVERYKENEINSLKEIENEHK